MKRRGWLALLLTPIALAQKKKPFDPNICPLGHTLITQLGPLPVGVDGKGGKPLSALANPDPRGAVGFDPALRLFLCQDCGVLFIRDAKGVTK